MSDLVNRLRDGGKEASPRGELMWKASKRIEQLERELDIAEKMAADANEAYSQAHVSMIEALDQLTAEKALADRLAILLDVPFQSRMNMYHYKHCHVDEALDAHRKARGL